MRSLSLGFYIGCSFLCFGCTNNYERYEVSKTWQSQQVTFPTTETAPNFSHTIWIAPDERPGDVLITKVNLAKHKVNLNVYLLSDVGLIHSLILAHRNNIDVRIILERSVYANPKGNTAVFELLKNEGIPVTWADEVRQNFNHAKYIIIDDSVFVSTWNFTNTSFVKNREFTVGTSDFSIVSFMNSVFEADYRKFPFRWAHPSLYISPIDAREKLEFYLKNAKKDVRIFAASFSDERLLMLLESLQSSWVQVYLCLAYEENYARSELIRRMSSSKISFHQAKSPFVHAKTIEIDHEILLIWSQNFTQNSLDQNREIGLVIRDSPYAKKYREIIINDCRDK